MRQAILPPVEALFRVLFEYDCSGEERIPEAGPAIVAANHPSYLDPILLSLKVRRPIRFMAWEALFRVPGLGSLIRALGAFPVDTRRGQGHGAYAEAKRLVESGEVVGIFPEGRRSTAGWMEPRLREGAARLAYETGAPLVPATITGAYRAWPHFQKMPEPARIRVRYHDPIDPAPYRALPEEQAIEGLLAELRRRVERTLMPGVKADLRTAALYAKPAPWPRWHELIPAFGLVLLVFWRTGSWALVAPAYAYIGYLLLDAALLPARRITKWIRNASPVFFLLLYGGFVLTKVGLPAVPAPAALLAITSGAFFPYFYARGGVRDGFIQGMVGALCLELMVLHAFPLAAGPHLALPLFAAAYAWERRSVYWRYAVPVLLAYAFLAVRFFGLPLDAALPHVVTGLLAWLLSRLVGSAGRAPEDATPASPVITGLGLLDPASEEPRQE
jgi:1-acyl-sn-glycerol-3-phosphate acyltransferase